MMIRYRFRYAWLRVVRWLTGITSPSGAEELYRLRIERESRK